MPNSISSTTDSSKFQKKLLPKYAEEVERTNISQSNYINWQVNMQNWKKRSSCLRFSKET